MVNAATLPVMTRGTLLQTYTRVHTWRIARVCRYGLDEYGATLPSLIGVHVHVKCSACETVLNILVFSLKRKGADSEESRFEVWKMKIDNVTSVGEILSLEKEGRIKLVIRDH